MHECVYSLLRKILPSTAGFAANASGSNADAPDGFAARLEILFARLFCPLLDELHGALLHGGGLGKDELTRPSLSAPPVNWRARAARISQASLPAASAGGRHTDNGSSPEPTAGLAEVRTVTGFRGAAAIQLQSGRRTCIRHRAASLFVKIVVTVFTLPISVLYSLVVPG